MFYDYDVVVCGGGPAGIIAAGSSAENGAKTAIIERFAFLGGLASWGLVAPVSEFKINNRLSIGGLAWKFIETLKAENGADTSYPNGNIAFDNELYKTVATRFLQERNVDIFLNTDIFGAETSCENNICRIKHVHCNSICGNFDINAKIFIDCTGDAMLGLYTGVKFQKTDTLQPASLCMKIGNVDTENLENTKLMEHGKKYSNTRIRGILETLKAEGADVPLFGGPWFQQDITHHVVYANMTRIPVNPDDPKLISQTEIKLREDACKLFSLLKNNVPEFKNSFITQIGTGAGYRETRRISGKHILSGKELLSAVHFEDTIAHSNHPVDIHNSTDSSQKVSFLEQPGCIPFRSLYCETHPNLLFAGRCISADSEAFASVRVQAPCMAMGQAAGTAAAICVKNNSDVCQIKIPELLSTLEAQGAVLY